MAYYVDTSPVLLARARQLLTEARASGQASAFGQGLILLHTALVVHPHTFGEIKYHTPMGFPVYSAASGSASIYYVVYESRQAVCIVKIDRLGS